MQKIGIFGGSFNPPHLGHLRAAEFFAALRALDRLLVVPAGVPPQKTAPAVAGEDRLALCRLTFPGARFSVWDWELRQPGTSYTIDTLRHARKQWPNAAFELLVGEDCSAQFTQWKCWREILQLAQLTVLPREAPGAGCTPLPVSATQLRAMLRRREDASAFLAPQALRYILERGLYPGPVQSLQDCRLLLAGLVSKERLYHCERVAEAAAALAEQYGANQNQAMLAGMLHDCMKCAPQNRQRALCERIAPLRPADLAAPKVWHAFAGAAYLELECGVADRAILGAVRWHTLGHAGMSLLEEIVFVADLVSDDRTYGDAAHVRKLSRQNLHAASKAILEHTFQTLTEKRRPPHPDSLAWYSELKGAEHGTF
jgi:nicotinate-nucleotide adenylyltransferase